VSLETYFTGRFSALSALERIQRHVDAELPHLFVPNLQAGEALSLRPYQLRSEDKSESLAVAINQATYVSFAYPGSDGFLARALPLLSMALSEASVPTLDRVVYRYENVVGLAGVDGSIPIGRVLQSPLPSWSGADLGVIDLDLAWTRRAKHGHVAVRVSAGPAAPMVLNVIIASAVKPAGNAAELERFARLAHDEGQRMFEEMITPEFRATISDSSAWEDA
jgi:uncharacterized protein (TIGR04255 family)